MVLSDKIVEFFLKPFFHKRIYIYKFGEENNIDSYECELMKNLQPLNHFSCRDLETFATSVKSYISKGYEPIFVNKFKNLPPYARDLKERIEEYNHNWRFGFLDKKERGFILNN